MGKSSKPNFPAPPEFQTFPTVPGDIEMLSKVGRGLTSGNFLNPNDPTLGFLNPLVSLNPEATKTAVGLASRDVVELRDRAQQDILNQLEANNQLTSSTSVNRLSDLNQSFSSDIADIATNFYLADVERSMANIGGLFGLGLNTTQTSANLGQTQQGQQNAFALEQYDRQVALEAERFSRQQNSGFSASGALQGGLGGGMSAFIASGGNPFVAAAGAGVGAIGGGFGGQGTGTSILSGGLSSLGNRGSSSGSSGGFSSSTNLNFDSLTNRDVLEAQRINKGFGFGSAGGLA